MSIIYSYPEETSLQGSDMLIGTSTALVGGKQKNITKNFTLDQLTSFIQGGEGVINPAATDFQIAVFNQSGSKITGSIMSQDVYPSGTGITVSGNLSTTGNLVAPGTVTLGGGSNLIDLRSTTKFSGPIQDSNGLSGSVNQILLSNISGELVWGNYTAGLTYQGLWNAATNSPGLSSSVGVNSTFYIVGTAGNTVLNGNTGWEVGDWAIFVGTTGAGGIWQKIDNTSSITGNGTLNRMVMWSSNFTVTDGPLLDNSETNVLSVLDRSILPSVSNTRDLGSAALRWNMLYSNDIETTNINVLNHIDLAGLPGTPGQVFTSGGEGAPATWTTPTVGTITGTGQNTKIPVWTNSTSIGTSILTQLNAAGFFTNTYLSVDSGGISTPALKVDGFLLDSTGSKGAAGQILSSTGTATLWKTGDDEGVTYTLSAGAQDGTSVPINLTDSLSVTTPVKLTGGTNVDVVRTSATEITLSSTDTNTTYDFGSSTDGLDVLLNLVGTPTDDSSVKLIGSGVTITQTNDEVTFTVPAGDTYDLGSGASVIANSVELQLTSGSGTDNSAVTLTGGTGITVEQTGDVVTLTGVAQGITGSGTIGKLPKFDTTTSLTDSIISETVGGIAIAGELDMSNNKIVNVTNPTDAQDAATKSYVDTVVTGQLVFEGDYDATTAPPFGPSVLQGYTYVVTVAGDYSGNWPIPLAVGDLIIANQDNPVDTGDYTEVNKEVDIASETTLGIANFPTGNSGLNVTNGAVTAKLFSGTLPGYVPDASTADAGTFLKEDGTWAVAGTGTVTGTGVENYVTKWSAGGTGIENSTIFDNGSFVGIGTTSPSAKLHVEDTSNVGISSVYATAIIESGDAQLDITSGPGGTWGSSLNFIEGGGSANVDIWSIARTTSTYNSDLRFNFGTNNEHTNSTKVTFTSGGNVGIGTDSPSRTLTVNSGDQQVAALIESTSSLSSQINIKNSNSNNGGFVKTTGDNIILSANNSGLSHLVVADGGNVGIGTLSPAAKFQVGDGTVDEAARVYYSDGAYVEMRGYGLQFNRTISYIRPTTNGTNGLYFGTSSASWALMLFDALAYDFQTNAVSRLKIDYTGNVGIGTASPVVSLDISATDAVKIPVGITGDRPAGVNGMLRYNSDALEFEGYSNGAWGAIGGGGASATITTASHSGDGSTLTFALGATPNGGSVNFVDAYIDGVYQETSTYTVSGTNIVFNAGNAPAVGTDLQTKTTSDYNVGAAVQTVSLGQSNETGNVNLRIAPVEVLSATTPTATANHLYIFTATSGTPSTLTLPSNPVSGDSIKISNIGGLANVITPSGTDKIMGVAGSMTIDNPTAAFEMIWSGITAQGWVIIGNV